MNIMRQSLWHAFDSKRFKKHCIKGHETYVSTYMILLNNIYTIIVSYASRTTK